MKRHALTILTSILLVTGSASFAFAEDQCTIDSDCGASEICVEVTSGCPPPCRPGDDNCEPIECNPGKSKVCQPAPPSSCETTTDCAGDLVCVTTTITTCNGGTKPADCVPGDPTCETESEPPEESTCFDTTESFCAPPYMAPCTDDASCGSAGFTCEVVPVSCGCATTPDSGPDGKEGGEPAPEECDCPEPDESNRYCELEVLPCKTDNDCTDDFICHSYAKPAPDISCSSDAQTGETECEEDTTTSSPADDEGRCAPSDYRDYGGGGSKGDKPTTDDGGPTEGTDTGSTPGDGTGNTDKDPTPAAPGQNDADNDGNNGNINNEGSIDDGSCTIASLNTGKTSTAALFLAGAAAFFTFRRRRKN